MYWNAAVWAMPVYDTHFIYVCKEKLYKKRTTLIINIFIDINSLYVLHSINRHCVAGRTLENSWNGQRRDHFDDVYHLKI